MRRSPALATCAVLLAATLVSVAGPVVSARAAVLPPSEWVIGPHRKVVLLTFDGQAQPGVVEEVLDVLEKKNARASFFMSGAWLEGHKRVAVRLRRQEHAVGNRGYGKASFTSLDDTALRASIERAQRILNNLYLYPRPYLRPPNGARDLRVLNLAGSMGYRSVRWTDKVGSGLARKIQHRVVRTAQKGSIIDLDVWRKSHRKALPGIIDGLRRRGFSLATLNVLGKVHPVRWDLSFSSGSSGSEVAFLQKMLVRNSFPAGAQDGNFGYATLQAVYAFEKTFGLARDGAISPDQFERLLMEGRPWVPTRDRPKNFVDVDISRQVLFEVRKGVVAHTVPISSGNEEYYTSDGQTYKSHTPRGNFSVYRKIPGRRVSHLGTLWWPNYFTGGFAIHGSDSVPTYPASHGCIRIPRYVEQKFYYRNPVGMPVFVHD